jgi:RNA polymerase sigma factor (sigma-70 family)
MSFEKGMGMSADLREKQLIQKAKTGDESSFESLILSCQSRAFNIAIRYLKNEDDAMDALQESFIKIFRHLNSFKEDSRFDTWVYRIVVNTCNDMLRKNSNQKITDSIFKTEDEKETIIEIPDITGSPEEVFDKKEKTEHIISCLEKLNQEQKEIIVLRDIHGFSYDEISEILDCSIGTVKSRINRSRLRLREILLEQNQNQFV